MKKLLGIIIAAAMIFTCSSGMLLSTMLSVNAVLLNSLPAISGQVRVDNNGEGGIDGDIVVINNTGTTSQSSGDLGLISPSFDPYFASVDAPSFESSGKIDFAMPDVPYVEAPAMFDMTIPVIVGDTKSFVITNPIDRSEASQEFTLMADGDNCNIWAEIGSVYEVNGVMAGEIAAEFERGYTNVLLPNFGSFYKKDSTVKVNIMMYDIQDENNPSAYIAGFFYGADFGGVNGNSNNTAMLHIDTYPSIYSSQGSKPRVENAFSTVAHEMQHMINYSQTTMQGNSMDTWLNEALSMAAEELIYPGSAVDMRLGTYNYDMYGAITGGKSLLNFDNSLDSYALSCLFAEYLKSQSDSAVFSRIIDNFTNDEGSAIEAALAESSLKDLSFEDVTSAYRIALAKNSPNGIYGFNGRVSGISPHIYSGGGGTLPPGGSITVKPDGGNFQPNGNGTDIQFFGISDDTGAPIITNKPADMVAGENLLLDVTYTGTDTLVWSSSDPTIAEVDQTGNLTAKGIGSTTITLTAGTYSDSFVLTVGAPSASIEGFRSSMMVGTSAQLKAVTRPAVTPAAVKWTSSDAAILKVDANGNATAVSAGTAEVTLDVTFVGGATAKASASATITEASGYPGLDIDVHNNVINVVASIGMQTLATIVNTSDTSFDAGLEGWTVNQTVPVTLINHVPIGTNANSFKGIYNGQSMNITFESAALPSNLVGVFGQNHGTINDIVVNITGTVGDYAVSYMNTGGVAAANWGQIINPTVMIAEGASLLGLANGGGAASYGVGGIAGFNKGLIKNAFVTNNGLIRSDGTRSGGIAGHSNNDYFVGKKILGMIDTATVYNNGSIECQDDLGGLIGLNSGGAYITGDINVTITANGKIKCEPSNDSASVGGVVGFCYGGDRFGKTKPTDKMHVTLRLDGDISTNLGVSGGVIGQGGFGVTADLMPDVAVTLGPDAKITGANAEKSGLITGGGVVPDHSKVAYAVPYDSQYLAFPSVYVDRNADIKRIEYPKAGNPDPTIQILDPDEKSPTNVIKNAVTPDGIFMKKNTLSGLPLIMESALDAEIFDINLANQTVESRFLTKESYYDFNMTAGGIPIVVPAYLNVIGKLAPPAMTLDITGAHVRDTKDEAIANSAQDKQTVNIIAKNGRITSWDVEKDGNPYQSSIAISQNTDLLKVFSVSDKGLYKITATAKPLDSTKPDVTVTKWLMIGKTSSIALDGEHLTNDKDENRWTNLGIDSKDTKPTEEITATAVATDIENLIVTRGGKLYRLFPEDFRHNTSDKQIFILSESGRYEIFTSGVGISKPVIKYVNIDVDRPLPPIYDEKKVTANCTEVEMKLPMETMNQSPIYAEYSANGVEFILAPGSGILPFVGKTLAFRTVDLAGNISDVVLLTRTEAPPVVPPVVTTEPPETAPPEIKDGDSGESANSDEEIIPEPPAAPAETLAPEKPAPKPIAGIELPQTGSHDLLTPILLAVMTLSLCTLIFSVYKLKTHKAPVKCALRI